MAITTTELEVYSGNAVGTLVGTKITKSGSPSSINLNSTELGVALQPGHQYCCRARVYNTDLVWSDWTTINSASTFITLILAELLNGHGGGAFNGNCGQLEAFVDCTYDSSVIQVSDVGVYLSTSSDGANAVKVSAGGDASQREQRAEDGWDIDTIGGNPVAENTTYYAVPYVVDSLGREYVGDWANDVESVNSGYRPPVISMSNKVTTVNSLSASLNVTTNGTLNSIIVYVKSTSEQSYHPFTLPTQTGLQNFTIADGDTDDNGNTISIAESTEYHVYVNAWNRRAAAGGGYENDCPSRYPASNATPNYEAFITQAAVAGYVRIDSISNISPNSAVCNLSYNENAQPNPSQNQ